MIMIWSRWLRICKYWEEYSTIFFFCIAPFWLWEQSLDPRMKLAVLEIAYEKVDPFTSSLKTKEVRDI